MSDWLAGAATGDDRVYLRTAASLPAGAADIRRVLVHELTHLYLRRRTAGHPLPRWFEEGLAVRQAGPPLLGRPGGSVADRRPRVHSRRWPPGATLPRGEEEARVAYAASADFVLHLRERVGRPAFAGCSTESPAGRPSRRRSAEVFGGESAGGRALLAAGFRAALAAALLLAGGGSTWAFATVVFLLVSWRKRIISKPPLGGHGGGRASPLPRSSQPGLTSWAGWRCRGTPMKGAVRLRALHGGGKRQDPALLAGQLHQVTQPGIEGGDEIFLRRCQPDMGLAGRRREAPSYRAPARSR